MYIRVNSAFEFEGADRMHIFTHKIWFYGYGFMVSAGKIKAHVQKYSFLGNECNVNNIYFLGVVIDHV